MQNYLTQLMQLTRALVCSVAGLITKRGECLLIRVLQYQQHVPSLAKYAKAFCTWYLHFLGFPGVAATSHPRRHGGDSLASGASFWMSAIRRAIPRRVLSQFACQTLLCE